MLKKAEAFVFDHLKNNLKPELTYHNYNHTHYVVEAAKEICEASELSEEDTEIILLAAWFHDTGFSKTVEGHEEESANIATEFLAKQNYPSNKIEKVVGCIRATKMPQNPKTELEKIMCDADVSNLGKKIYAERNELLKVELENLNGKDYSQEEWLRHEVDFLSKHQYFTPFASLNYAPRKAKNVAELNAKINKIEQDREKEKLKLSVKEKEFKWKQEQKAKPDRGIETMFRVALRNHISLSQIADNKANIMLSINAIILSIAFSSLFPSLDKNPHLVLPSAVMTLMCLVTMVFSILSTRPKVTEGRFTKDDIQQKKTNLLFFGNFYNMPLDDFKWGMDEMMKDKEFLYGSLTKDLYFLGAVLGRKYKLLRTTYNVFMVGMILTVLAFAYAFMTFDWSTHEVAQTIAQ